MVSAARGNSHGTVVFGGASMLALAWLVLCAHQLVLASSTLSAQALGSACAVAAGCAVWAGASRAARAVGAARGPATAVACGAASSIAGELLAFSPGGAWSLVMLFAHVAFACEVVSRVLAPPPGRSASCVLAVAGGGLVLAAAVHWVARILAGSIGSLGNVGFYAQVSLVITSLLPALAAVAAALAGRGPARSSGREEAPATASGTVWASAPVPGVAALVALFDLFAFMALAFCGAVTMPYQVDMTLCGDWSAIATMAVGALAWAVSRAPERRCVSFAFGLAVASVLAMLGGMLSYAVSAAPVSLASLVAVQAAGACLLVSAWALTALGPLPGRKAVVSAALLTALPFAARFLGHSVKHAIGLDGHTVVVFVLVVMVVLAIILMASVLAVAASSHRALRMAEGEKARAIEGAVEDAIEGMRHDPDHAFDALRQVYSDALSEFGLSDREMEIAILALTGNSIETIGEIAGISPNTVRWHLNNVYSKAGVGGKKMLRAKVDELLSRKSQ